MVVIAAGSLMAAPALANPTGEAQGCIGCHYDTDGPTIELDFSNATPDPSETIVVTVRLQAEHPEALRTGVFLSTEDQGAFSLLDTDGTRFAMEGSASAVVHAQPRNLDGDGRAEFAFEWTAPAGPGVSDFTVWSMTGNSNGESSDDHHATHDASIPHGCDALNYYPDSDGDGYGDADDATLSCDPIPGLIVQGGDCNDADPVINPDAVEVCNAVDDDCDGQADQGLEPGLYYPDPDGDGYAADGAFAEFGCNDREGFTAELGDCAPEDPDVYPGAPEVDNGRDDNCNGEIDEDTSADGGSDDDGASGDDDAGPSAPMDTDGSSTAGLDEDGGGCAVDRSPAPWTLSLLLLSLLGTRRRRRVDRG